MKKEFNLTRLEDYEKQVGAGAIERLNQKAEGLKGMHIAHMNSTYYGGGVAEILDSLSLLMNDVGIKTGLRIIEEAADRIVRLIKDEDLKRKLGEAARESVKKRFLLNHLLEKYLDLFNSFETKYRLKNNVYNPFTKQNIWEGLP